MNSNLSISWLPKAKISWLKTARNSLSILLFLIGTLPFFGQRSLEKELHGKVTVFNGDVTGVVVKNLNKKTATITDQEGRFSIAVSLADTLAFSSIQYKRKILPITPLVWQSLRITVPLEKFVNELGEVVLNAYGLTGDIATDALGLGLSNEVNAISLGLPNAGKKHPSQSQRLLAEANGGSWDLGHNAIGFGTAIPLNPIINAISGRTKMLKDRLRVDYQYSRTQRVRAFYTDSIFENTFKVPRNKIEDFMYFCEVDQEFQDLVDLGDYLQLWEYMINKGEDYVLANNLKEK